jgi:hypothetical protein
MAILSPERRAALEKEKAKHHSGGAFFKMTGTKAVIRLLPLAADEEIGTKVTQHFIGNKGYTCPMGTHGRPGVIDTATRALRKLGDAESMEIADGLDANRNTKYCLKMIDRADPSTPKIYRAPYTVYKVVFEAFFTDGEDLADINEGCDIRISKEGSNKGTKYDVRVLKPSPLVADEDGNPMKKGIKELVASAANTHTADLARTDEQGALDALADNLPKHLWKQIKAEVTAVLAGASDGEESEEDTEEAQAKPAKKKAAAVVEEEDDDEEPAKPAPKKKAAPVEDDEDDEPAKAPAKKKVAAPVEDDEDDEPAPAKKPAAKKAAPAEEEDADAEDDEDDAPPAKTPAKKKAAAPVEDDEDDEEPVKPAPKKTAPVIDEDEDDEPAPAKKPATRFKPRA